ncbi:MAG: hypothetical protein ACI8QZ_000118 [Chlamydiales bacterium]|jgi:hypothetical protein
MHRILILGALALMVGGLGVTRLVTLESRLDHLDEFRREGPRRITGLSVDLSQVQQELGQLRSEVTDLDSAGGDSREGILERIRTLQAELNAAAHGIATLRSEHASFASADIDERLEQFVDNVDGQWTGLSRGLTDATVLAQRNHAQIGRLDAEASPDPDQAWRDIMGPTVQLAGSSTVGSGVLLESQQTRSSPAVLTYRTLVMTAWHVVRDIRADAGDDDVPIPVFLYSPDGSRERHTATLLIHNVALDVALLELNSDRRQPYGAHLAARARVQTPKVFQPIYAAGCPLGNDPIPTRGEIAAAHHVVDGSSYWMISAPTYIGNSGGGVFDKDTHELLGIFSKIYTHGNLRPTVIPHMGLMTPLNLIYDWIEEEGHGQLMHDEKSGLLTLLLEE